MRTLKLVTILTLIIVGFSVTNIVLGQTATPRINRALEQMHDQLMKPTVRVSTGRATGSGTVVYSADRDEANTFETYVLTNHHVIDSAIHIEERWDPDTQRMRKTEERDRVKVEIFVYDHGTAMGQNTFRADIVGYDAKGDIALLKLYSPRQVKQVAPLFPFDLRLHVFQPVYIIGCSLAHEPIPSSGYITDTDDTINHRRYVMTNAQVIFGNSGGAAFVRANNTWCLAGIPSRVAMSRASAVEHMSWIVPIERIRVFLNRNFANFIQSETISPKQERARAAREKRSNDPFERIEELLRSRAEADREKKREN